MVLGGADGRGAEEGCGGNEEEKELRCLVVRCVEETGVLFISLFFDITCEYSSYFVFVLDLLLKHLFNEIHLISVRGVLEKLGS